MLYTIHNVMLLFPLLIDVLGILYEELEYIIIQKKPHTQVDNYLKSGPMNIAATYQPRMNELSYFTGSLGNRKKHLDFAGKYVLYNHLNYLRHSVNRTSYWLSKQM